MDDDRRQEGMRRKLARSLEGFVHDAIIDSAPRGLAKIEVGVVSPTFEGMDEARRQELVWGRVLDTFEADEWRRIAFIYTDAPSEVAAKQAAQAAHGAVATP